MTRLTRGLVVAILLAFPTVVRAGALATAEDPKLRCTTKAMCHLLQRGLELSPTLADLADRIQRSDVIVYLQFGQARPGTFGFTTLMAATAFARFVLVTIEPLAPPADLLARLGHELQHVVEIAEAREVCDAETLRQLLRKIGWTMRADQWETEEAMRQGRRVRDESTGPRPAVPLAREDHGLREARSR